MNQAGISYFRRCLLRFSGAFLLVILSFSYSLKAQFYSGSQLTFGKCRVQYHDFFWTYFRFDKFDTYFYLNGKELATFTAEYADKHLKEIESDLQSGLEEKIQFVIFNNLTDLKQSNIGLSGEWDNYNTGGVTRIIGGRVLLYFDGNYEHFEQQIRAGIATVILNEMVYGTGVGAQIKNNALFTMPDWYMKGLVSYISEKWNTQIDNTVRDAIINGKYRKFNHLSGDEAVHAGHSLWNYIALKYGESAIPNIVYMARVSRNVEKGFLYVLNINFSDLTKQWLEFYKGIYFREDADHEKNEGMLLNKHPRQDRIYRQLKISPVGDKATYCYHELGVYKVFLTDLNTGKTRRILRGGYRLQEKEDYTYPVLAWNPSGNILAMITETKGRVCLTFYNLEEKSKESQFLYDFDKVLDFAYSDDGMLLVMSAVRKGQSDIFVFNIASGSWEQITKDIYNDLNPRFLNHSKEIIFSSNRVSDTLRFDPKVKIDSLHFRNDLFIYDYAAHKNILYRVTNTPEDDEIQPMPWTNNYFTYLSDRNGIYNRYLAKFDSTISYVDTVTHYRYFTSSIPVTNYPRNIVEQESSPGSAKSAEIVFAGNHYSLYTHDMILPQKEVPRNIQNTFWKEVQMELQGKAVRMVPDSSALLGGGGAKVPKKHFRTVRESDIIKEDSGYLQKRIQGVLPFSSTDTLHMARHAGEQEKVKKDTADKYALAKALNYNVEYYIDQMVTQVDFNYLNTAYQPFTNAQEPIFINPGMNALFMVGITDLMEDYHLTGGIRLNTNLVNNEYLLSYTNLRHRIDHQFIFHRQSVEEVGDYSYIRHRIHEFFYIATYPFTPVLNLKGTATLRYDRAVYLSTDDVNLKKPDVDKYWGTLKAELTYDNTRSLGLNLYNGTRYKIFGEYYQMLNGRDNNMFVIGADYRHYMKIHRTLILAMRCAASTSFGTNKLVYYMGGVDNWLVPSFNSNTPVAQDQNYTFQTLATNMRGFSQNIRNGNSFALVNMEFRMPVFRYFLNRPIRSDFINNLQVVAFGDAGTAWTGISPYSEKNELYTTYISNQPLYIKVQMIKDPVVEGFGFGLRSRIFGYFLRGDLAWGVEDGRVSKDPVFYLSLSLDF
ncbi:MAG: hypothetical protein Q8867_05030 [Bacteroidota bacterium]|nr:hypothetical protein [Bacteroidota bacterium]